MNRLCMFNLRYIFTRYLIYRLLESNNFTGGNDIFLTFQKCKLDITIFVKPYHAFKITHVQKNFEGKTFEIVRSY